MGARKYRGKVLVTEYLSQHALQTLDTEEAIVHWRTWVLEKLRSWKLKGPHTGTRKQTHFLLQCFSGALY